MDNIGLNTDNIGNIIGIIAIILFIFLIIREIICWYWKINERTELLREIRDLLRCNVPEEKAKEIETRYSEKDEIVNPKSKST